MAVVDAAKEMIIRISTLISVTNTRIGGIRIIVAISKKTGTNVVITEMVATVITTEVMIRTTTTS